jgi:hypothetical protein
MIQSPIVRTTGAASAAGTKFPKYKCPMKLRYKLQENVHIMGATF